MNDSICKAQASDDFSKYMKRSKFKSLLNAIVWKNDDLLSFYEVTSIIKPKNETYLGMRTIEVNKIIGSEGRHKDFSNAFLPKKDILRARWESIDRAMMNSIILPPISVYSLGGFYFVRDGNHRVSVARTTGIEFIDAEVVELDSQIKLDKDVSIKQLKRQVVDYERNMFIKQYVPSYLPMGEIVFTTPGSYAEMVNHILVHKYYINQSKKEEILFEKAAYSWWENVYNPIIIAIREEKLLLQFPGSAEGDIYMWFVRKWDDIKKQNEKATVFDVAKEVSKETTVKTFIHRWFNLLKEKIAKR